MSSHRTLIRGACVLTMDPELGDLEVGDVLVEDTRIADLAAHLSAAAVDEVVDGRGCIVMPGLVDTHIHLWETGLRGLATEMWGTEYFEQVLPYRTRMRPSDMYVSGYAGALELLSRGVTTVLDYCHCIGTPSHADAAADALIAAGIRGVHAPSLRAKPDGHFTTHQQRLTDIERVATRVAALPGELLTMAVALSDMEYVDQDVTPVEIGLARRLGLPMTVHCNSPDRLARLESAGLLADDILPVHCNRVVDDELAFLGRRGAWIAVTPELELGMGHNFNVVSRARQWGVGVALGNDIAPYASADLFVQMRMLLQVQRYFDAIRERIEERGGRRSEVPSLTPRDVLRFGTIEGARALRLADVTGSLTPGKAADLVLLATRPFGRAVGDPAAHVVSHAGAHAIDSVMVAGTWRARGGQLVGVDTGECERLLGQTREHLFAASPGPTLIPEAHAAWGPHEAEQLHASARS